MKLTSKQIKQDIEEIEAIERERKQRNDYTSYQINKHSRLEDCLCAACNLRRTIDKHPATKTKVSSTAIMVEEGFEFDAAVIARDNLKILFKKHNDYGKSNIADAPGGALNGLSVRLHDKVARLNNLLSNNKEPEYESIKDTFIDISNYAIIALMVIDGKWDNTK